MIYLSNAFSLNMLPSGFMGRIFIGECNVPLFLDVNYQGKSAPFTNCIGHSDTDAVVRDLLEKEGVIIPKGERKSVTLKERDVLLIAQYIGQRLPEGTTTLPEGSEIVWKIVYIED